MALTKEKTNTKGISFDLLHEASQKWLSEIDFWKDEIAFFYKLLRIKTSRQSEVLGTADAKVIERHLLNISSGRLDELKQEVLDHEKFLSRVLADIEIDEKLYFSRHKAIAKKVHAFEAEFKNMKKDIFRLAEKIRR